MGQVAFSLHTIEDNFLVLVVLKSVRSNIFIVSAHKYWYADSFFLTKDRYYVYTSQIMFPLYANYNIVLHTDTCWIMKSKKILKRLLIFALFRYQYMLLKRGSFKCDLDCYLLLCSSRLNTGLYYENIWIL